MSNTIKLYAKQRKLTNMVANEIFEKERNGSLMITILSHIVEFRNGESGMHVINIGTLTEILLNQISKKDDRYYLPYAERDLIVKASALHDIGKISIPEEVLNKPRSRARSRAGIMNAMMGADTPMGSRETRSPFLPRSSPWLMSMMRSPRSASTSQHSVMRKLFR